MSTAHHVVGGVVHVRVDDADDADLAVVTRQLGPAVADPGTAADLVLRFTDALATEGEPTWAGYHESSFDDRHFYLHDTRAATPKLVRLPLDRLGEGETPGAEVLVEHGARNVPLLVALVNLLALGQGVVPVHASTVVHRGRTLLACGWSKGGKTEMMVALEREGATYVADEWSYLRRDGDRTLARSLPEPVRVWHWQLAQLPELRQRVTSRKKRTRLTALDRTSGLLSSMSERGLPGRDVWRRAAPVLARQAYVQVPPARLFDGRVADEAAVDQVLLVHSRPGDETRVSPVDGTEVAARMRHSLAHERLPFTHLYQQYRFAFPDRVCALAERAEQAEAEMLDATLAPLPASRLVHPYPADLSRIAGAINGLIDGGA